MAHSSSPLPVGHTGSALATSCLLSILKSVLGWLLDVRGSWTAAFRDGAVLSAKEKSLPKSSLKSLNSILPLLPLKGFELSSNGLESSHLSSVLTLGSALNGSSVKPQSSLAVNKKNK